VAALLMAGIASAEAQPAITWRVENPFRFFADPFDAEVHRSTYLALSPDERRQPVLSAERALARRHEDGWAAAMSGPVCFDDKTYRFACPATRRAALTPGQYINPQSHTVLVEATPLEVGADAECVWSTAPVGRRQLRGEVATRPCREPVALEIPYPGGAMVTLEIGGVEVARSTIRVKDLLIAGMGDSFASGEGNPDIPIRFSAERAVDYSDTTKFEAYGGYPARVGGWQRIGDPQFIAENARWLDQACHRSLYSHQLRAALQLAVEDPHRAVTFVGVACSGAEITAGLFLRYKGHEWVPNPPALSQISALAEAQCGSREAPFQDLPEAYHLGGRIPELQGGLVLRKCDTEVARRLDLVMLSIGGNDVGFARLVANAILADQSTLKRLGGWFGQVHGASESSVLLERLDDRYKSLNRALRNILHIPWNESDRVILTGYPRLALLEDGRSTCPDGSAGMDVLADFSLSSTRAREGDELAERLNSVMRRSAREHGWVFADRHRSEFLGRGLCAGFTDNALSSADDLRLPRRVNGEWVPYSPADYRPYAPRQRWFRTPNDAFLTANFHVPRTLLQTALKSQTLSWVQILLASTYSGAFHPTAEGQAAMADAVVEKARAVLDKYEGRNREK
jgi:lysophospholipase L1-like esterase